MNPNKSKNALYTNFANSRKETKMSTKFNKRIAVAIVLLLLGMASISTVAMAAGSNCDGGDGVYLYEHINYAGKCFKFTSNSSSPDGWYVGNDAVSSVRIVGNYKVTLYEHADYKGASSTFEVSDLDLRDNSVGNDRASSIKVEKGTTGWCSCLVYLQNTTGFPPTGDANFPAENYANWLKNRKDSNGNPVYNVSFLSADPNNPGALNNSFIIWSASRMQNSYGHIAVLIWASYNSSTKEWTFTFRDANGYLNTKIGGPFKDVKCDNVYVTRWSTKNLSGITFFRASKR